MINRPPDIYGALLHFPVYNKNREIVTTCISSYDLHDISRAIRCYGLHAFFVVNPLDSQRQLAHRIIRHWVVGYGADYNPTRKMALEYIQIRQSLSEVITEISAKYNTSLKIIATSSQFKRDIISYAALQREIGKRLHPLLILFGTGWGICDEIINKADYLLEPIMGNSDYNHLSVRSAAAIVLDRLFGDRHAGGNKHA